VPTFIPWRNGTEFDTLLRLSHVSWRLNVSWLSWFGHPRGICERVKSWPQCTKRGVGLPSSKQPWAGWVCSVWRRTTWHFNISLTFPLPPIIFLLGLFCHKWKWPNHEDDYTSSFDVEIKNTLSSTSMPSIHLHGMVLVIVWEYYYRWALSVVPAVDKKRSWTYGLLCCVVLYIGTNVSDEPPASIFRAKE
jgi:hypothetical protein